MFKNALIKSAKQLLTLKSKGAINNFALIGGMALAAYVEPRATADIDYLVQLGNKNLDEVAAMLKGKPRHGDVYDPLAGSISFTVKAPDGNVPIQLIQFHPAVEQLSVDNIETLKIGTHSIPIVNRRALILLKLFAGGPIDMQDSKQLLSLKELNKKDLEYIRLKAQALRISNRLKKSTGDL